MVMNGYNFTERVRKVLAGARVEATNLRHAYVGTEHILLSIVREGDGVATAVLANLGVDRNHVVDSLLDMLGPGAEGEVTGPDLPYTSRGKKAIELAMAEARLMQHSYVGTEHLLLGLIAEQKGPAGQVLASFGVTIDRARQETMRLLGKPAEQPKVPDKLVAHPAAAGYARSRSPYGVALVDDFTGRARDVLRAAYEEASTRDHGAVELSHLLLALASREDGMAAVLIDQVAGSRKALSDAMAQRLPDKEAQGDRR